LCGKFIFGGCYFVISVCCVLVDEEDTDCEQELGFSLLLAKNQGDEQHKGASFREDFFLV
jgi:hypothetical protein